MIGRVATILVTLLLAASAMLVAAPAAAQRTCTVKITISPDTPIRNRDALKDANGGQGQPGIVTCNGGSLSGTPEYIQGFDPDNTDDTGAGDTRASSSIGTARAENPARPPIVPDQGRWASNDGFLFYYQPVSRRTTTATDNFRVDVYNSQGAIIAFMNYQVTVATPPTVTNITPGSGGLGAVNLVITGTNFTSDATVTVGGVAATGVTLNSSTQITATVPATTTPGNKAVVVTTSGGTSNNTILYRHYTPATISAAFAPATVPTGNANETTGDSTLTFTLTNPSGNVGQFSSIRFSTPFPANLLVRGTPRTTCNSGVATFANGSITLGATNGTSGAFISAGQSCNVTATVYGTQAGSYQLTPGAVTGKGARDNNSGGGTELDVTGSAGAAVTLTVQNPVPTVTSIAPTGGSTGGGTPVTITGTNFVSGNTYTASFGANTVTATYASATTLTATAPAGTGFVEVTVTNTTTSQAGTGSATFVYAAPTVTSVSPNSGPANQTRAVTITGTNFTPSATVSVGGTAATNVTYASATQLTATLPAKAAGTYDVLVTTGSTTTTAGPNSQFTYVPAPTITSVTPNSGTTAGGTLVTITGSSLVGTTAVTFGGNAATDIAVAGDGTSLTARTPQRAAGAADVAVTTPGGTATIAGGFAFVVLSPPAVQTQPANQEVAVGATATFTASTTGSPAPTAQWQSAPAGGTFTDIQGATGTSYTTPATVAGDNGRQYRVVFTNSEGTATSSAATLTVVQAPTANAQTVAVMFDTATAITLTGTDPNTPARTLTYQVATQPAHGGLSGTAPNLTYTPTRGYAGADSFTFTTSNGIATSAPATVSINVGQGSQTITFTSTAPTAARARGVSYTVTATATSGQPVTFTSATAGVCTVSGATVDFVGVGTCTIAANQAGNASYTAAPEATQSFTVAAATITFSPPAGRLPGGTVGVAYSVIFTASGGNGPYTYAVTAGALPPGMTLDQSTGRFSGRPTGSGQASFTITATDSTPAASGGPFTGSAAYTVNIQAPTIVIAPQNLPAATGGTAYSQQLTASGGTAPYTFTTAGPLPRGLSLSPGGLLSGTPAESGTFVFDVRAIDSTTGGPEAGGGYAGTRTYELTVGAPTIALAPTTIPNPRAGAAYSQALTASGGSGSYTFAITAGALPVGVTLSAQGVLSGTPTEGGIRQFTVTAIDGNGFEGRRTYQVTVQPAAIAIAPETLPDATARVQYSQTLTATGGTTPYTFQLVSGRGTPPAGLTLASDGTLSGSPTQVGSFTFDVRATDSSTGSGPFINTRTYTLNVGVPAIVLAPPSLPQTTTRVAYTQTVSASGGNAPYRFAVTAGAIPAGLTLGADGTFQGAPTTAGTFNLTITATDADGNAGSRGYTLTVVAPAIVLAPATLPPATTRIAYSQSLTASGGTAPYTYAVTAGALPAGLTLAAGGTLAGTATAAGSFTFTITATDANGNAGARGYTLEVASPAIVLAPATLPDGAVAAAYSQAITATGGTGSFGYAVTAGALPAGIALASNGTLSGTPTAGGTFGFTVTATDANGNAGTRSYTLTVAAPTLAIAPAALPDGARGVSYSQTLSATGGTAPYSYAVTAGTLPAGLTMSTGGVLSGQPTGVGSFTFTVTARDASTGNGPFAGNRTYTLAITAAAVTLAPETLPAGTTRTAYSQSLSATGGTAPYRYAITAGALPAGYTLATGGTLSGSTTAAGTFNFTATATDAFGNTGSRAYTLVIDPVAITLAPATLPGATTRIAYSQSLSASGGTGPYSYAVTAGALPAGVSLTSTGVLAGSTSTAGSYTFTVTATDANGNSGSRGYTLAVAAPAIVVAPATLPAATTRIAYSQTLSASGGVAPYTYALTAGALPTGLTLNGATLSGSPTAAGTFAFTVTATDVNGNTGNQAYSLTVTAPAIVLAPQTLATARVGETYAAAITASGGAAPYNYAVTAGSLPAGVTLGSDGALSGTPTAGGSFTITVQATDANGNVASRTYTLTVDQAAVVIAPATLPAGQVRTAYSQAITASGGTAPYSYAVSAGALPAGITLSATGTVSGTPTQSGSFTFTVSARDSSTGAGPYVATRSYTLAIDAPALTLAPATLPAAVRGATYSATFSASGGTAPYTYTTTGTLPPGLTLTNAGVLQGRATTGGTYDFTVTATDATSTGNGGPYTVSRAYSVVVTVPTITLAPNTLPSATTRIAYSQSLTATGGVAPYSYAVTAGALPAGIALAADGTLAGSATAAGSYTFTVTATDANGNAASQAYTLAVTSPAIALAPATLPGATTRIAYSQTLTTIGGAAPYSYAVTGGALPSGITLSPGGTLAGSATAAGNYTFTVTAIDANGNSGTQAYTLPVSAPAIVLAPQALPNGSVAAAYTARLSASGGSGAVTFAVTAGALPTGLSLAADGTLAGTVTAGGSFAFTVTATDANGNTGARDYTIAVAAPSINIEPGALEPAVTRVAYRQVITASGGVAPYRFTVTAGVLPTGLTFAADGTLSGRATTAGTYRFTVTATDSASGSGPYRAAQEYTLTVSEPTIALTPATLPAGSYATAYTATVTATGGTAPYSYSVIAGDLPAGISLSSGGVLSGTPAAAGVSSFTVSAVDANGNAGAIRYTLTIAQAAQTITFADPGTRSLSDRIVPLTATSSSGLPISFVSTPTGACTVQGSNVTLLDVGTCTIEARQAGDANVAAATPVARSFAITAARLVATEAQASVTGTVGTALTTVSPVTAAGGTQPYSFALTGGTLPAGISFSTTTGALSGTPTAGLSATRYTVSVRDAGGQTASGSFTLSIASPTLAITPTTLPAGTFRTAYSAQLSASGGTQPYRFAVTGGALPAGVTLSSSGLLSGTPTAFGRFDVTVTATDSSTGTGPYSAVQAYTLTIAAPAVPTAVNVSATVAFNASGATIVPQVEGEATALAVVRQPGQGSVRIDGRTFVYTPRAGFAGSDSFTYTVEGPGGTSAPATVSVTVSAPTIALTPATLPDARQDAAYSAQLSTTGGTAPYTYTVASGSLPAGISLTASGAMSGTPTTSGPSSFVVRVTDSSTGAGPFVATQSYTLEVAAPAAPVVIPLPTNVPGTATATNRPTQIILSDYVTGSYTAIEIDAQPSNGTVTLSRAGGQTIATYVPRTGFAGTDRFAFVAVGAGGRSASQSVTLTVSGTAPIVAPLTVTTTQGVPVSVDVSAAASGGPFTAAAITGASPANAITATVVEGGTAGARTYRLTLTPSSTFSGTATVTYTLSNQYGTSTPATIAVTVAARPDPTSDPTVNGVSTAQADATRRFARAQTDNYVRRNEQLHGGGTGTGGRSLGVGLQLDPLTDRMGQGVQLGPDPNDMAVLKAEHARGVLGAELGAGEVRIGRADPTNVTGARGRDGIASDAVVPSRIAGQQAETAPGSDTSQDGDGTRRVGSVGVWSGGAVTVGAWDRTTDRAKLTLTTGGLSAGADVKLADNLIVGLGGGYGGDLTRVGDGAARIRGRSWSLAGYGSWSPTAGLFVDGILGAGEVSFDVRRRVAQSDVTALGNRDGSMLFGSLAAGYDRRGAINLSAYGRVDYLSARLDRYSETGAGIYSLTYGRRDLQSLAGVLGFRAGVPLRGWTPRLRGEWRHEFADLDAQSIDYADVANLRYTTRGDAWLRDALTIDLGAEFLLGRGWGLTTEIGGSTGSGATAGTGRVGVRKEF